MSMGVSVSGVVQGEGEYEVSGVVQGEGEYGGEWCGAR